MWENWFIIGCVAIAFFVQPLIVSDKSNVWFWVYRISGWGLFAMVLSSNVEQFLDPQFAEVAAYVCLLLAVIDVVLMFKNIKHFF